MFYILEYGVVALVAVALFKWGYKKWKKYDVEEKQEELQEEKEMAETIGKVNRKEVVKNRDKIEEFKDL